jgi:hypothetical protein
MPLFDEPKGNHDCAPNNDYRREKDTRAELPENDRCRGLECNVGDKEQQNDKAVPLTGEFQIYTHTRYHGNAKVGSIHKGNAVHEAQCRNKPQINLADDLLLLFGGECIDCHVVCGIRAVGRDTFNHMNVALLFCIAWSRHIGPV